MSRDDAYRQTFAAEDRARNDQRGAAPWSVPAAATREPYDPGQILWTAPRGKHGTERLRLARRVFESHPFLDLRIEYRDRESGEWRPTTKGISIRLREIADLEAVLAAEVERLATDPGASR